MRFHAFIHVPFSSLSNLAFKEQAGFEKELSPPWSGFLHRHHVPRGSFYPLVPFQSNESSLCKSPQAWGPSQPVTRLTSIPVVQFRHSTASRAPC